MGTDHATLRARGVEFWAATAPGWIRHADFHDEVGRPLGAVALDRLAAQPGERVLDVGCGCGGTTAELAVAVSPGGTAVGVDLSESLVAAAAQRFPSVRFLPADAETLGEVPGAPFDAAFSRMAIMLFADPVAGCRTIRRSLRPGGRLAATVFRDAGVNPWLAAALLGAAPSLGPLGPLPMGDEPGPFAFADAARVQRILAEAGYTAIEIQAHDVVLRPFGEAGTVAEWLIEVGPASAAYRSAPPSARLDAQAGVIALLERFRAPGRGYELPAGLWLVTASA